MDQQLFSIIRSTRQRLLKSSGIRRLNTGLSHLIYIWTSRERHKATPQARLFNPCSITAPFRRERGSIQGQSWISSKCHWPQRSAFRRPMPNASKLVSRPLYRWIVSDKAYIRAAFRGAQARHDFLLQGKVSDMAFNGLVSTHDPFLDSSTHSTSLVSLLHTEGIFAMRHALLLIIVYPDSPLFCLTLTMPLCSLTVCRIS